MKRFDIKHLPYIAAIFQALQFAHAGSVYFGPFGWVIGGVGGVITNLAIATAASRISDIAKSRKPLAYVLGGLMLLISPAAIAPAAYITASVVASTFFRIVVAIVWALLPDLSVALTGAIVGKSLISHSEPQKPQSGTERPATPRRAKASKPQSDIPCKYAGAGCDRTFRHQNGANAHAKTCKYKPTVGLDISIPNEAKVQQ